MFTFWSVFVCWQNIALLEGHSILLPSKFWRQCLIKQTLWDGLGVVILGDSRLSRYGIATGYTDITSKVDEPRFSSQYNDAAVNHHIASDTFLHQCDQQFSVVFGGLASAVSPQLHSDPAATGRIWTHGGKEFDFWGFYLFEVLNPQAQLCCSLHKCNFLTNMALFHRKTNWLPNSIRCRITSKKQTT